MQYYTYIVDTNASGREKDITAIVDGKPVVLLADPAMLFLAANFKTYKTMSLFCGSKKAVLSVGVDDKQVVATPKDDGVIYISEEDLVERLPDIMGEDIIDLSSNGFDAVSFIDYRNKRAEAVIPTE